MAFAIAGLSNFAVGEYVNVYTYYTTDTLTSVTFKAGMDTTFAPGVKAGDVIFVCDGTASRWDIVRIATMDATSCTYAEVVALA